MCHVYLRAKNTRFFLQLALKGFLVLFLVVLSEFKKKRPESLLQLEFACLDIFQTKKDVFHLIFRYPDTWEIHSENSAGECGGLIKSIHTRPVLILLFFLFGLLLYDILAFQIIHIYSRVVTWLIVVDQPALFISYACDVYIFCL
jgi:hypothetical protein